MCGTLSTFIFLFVSYLSIGTSSVFKCKCRPQFAVLNHDVVSRMIVIFISSLRRYLDLRA